MIDKLREYRFLILLVRLALFVLIPLLSDAFFVSMAVTIMTGLAFATVLTMIVVPVLYAIFFNAHADDPAPKPRRRRTTTAAAAAAA